MRRNVNKLATLVMTGMLAASMSFGAFADPINNGEAVTIAKNVTTASGETIKAPQTKFTLTVAAGPSTDVEIQTAQGAKTYVVTPGNSDQISAIQSSLKDADFTAAKTDTNNGYEVTSNGFKSNFKLTVDADIFSAPGLYSFKLTEVDSKYTGIKYDTVDKIMYVSVVNKKDATTGEYEYTTVNGVKKAVLEVESVVLATTKEETVNGKTILKTTKTSEITNDFGADSDNDSTHKVIIKKSVTGNAGDKGKEFTFNIYVAPIDGANVDKNNDGIVDEGSVLAPTTQGFTLTDASGVTHDITANRASEGYTIKDGETITIEGLTKDYTVYVSESQAGLNGYTTSYTVTTPVANGDPTTTSAVTLADANAKATLNATVDNTIITIENNRDNVTPTGVAMDVAPYALMVALAGGAAVTFLRKKESFED